jgi:hypothetical protein
MVNQSKKPFVPNIFSRMRCLMLLFLLVVFLSTAKALDFNAFFMARGHGVVKTARLGVCRRVLKAVSVGWQQSAESEDGMKYAHDEITCKFLGSLVFH